MKKLKILLVLVAVAACSWLLWLHFFPDEEKVVAGRLAKLAASISGQGKESVLRKGLSANRVVSFFASDASLNLEGLGRHAPNIQGRDELLQLVLAARSTFPNARVELNEIRVTVDPDGGRARALATVAAYLDGGNDILVHPLVFTLAKREGQWLIEKVEPGKNPVVSPE